MTNAELDALVARLKTEALEIEGDSDSPLRVAAANERYREIAALTTLRKQRDELREAVEHALSHRYGDWTGILSQALSNTKGEE